MKKMKQLGFVTLTLLTLSAASCKEGAKKESSHDHGKHSEAVTQDASNQGNDPVSGVINGYLAVKDALVQEEGTASISAAAELGKALASFDLSAYTTPEQQQLTTLIAEAQKRVQQFAGNDIAQQRAHFEGLSKNVRDIVGITGSPKTLYQQFCPMYNNNQGGMWLSASNEIRNPYFGSRMLKCGTVQEELN